MRKNLWLSLGLSGAGLLASLVLWNEIPNPMPVHWNASGQADGYMPRALGLMLMPVVSVGLTALLAALAKRMSQPNAQRAMWRTTTLMSVFMLAVHGLMIKASLTAGHGLSMGVMMFLMGALFLAIGLMMPGLEQNKWIGVRTPWTMTDEVNWKLTHRFAAISMSAAGAVTMLLSMLSLAPEVLVGTSLVAIFAGALSPLVASYVIHKQRN